MRRAKTWATAPALKAVVLMGSIVSAVVKGQLASTQHDRVTGKRRYSWIQAGLDQRSGEPHAVGERVSRRAGTRFSEVVAARNPRERSWGARPRADGVRTRTLGISFIELANGPEAPGE